jgi:hypothetical protein
MGEAITQHERWVALSLNPTYKKVSVLLDKLI